MVDIKKVDRPLISSDMLVKLTEMGNILELQYMSNQNYQATIKMLEGGEQYINLKTGEVKDVVHHSTRAEQYKSLYRTFKKLRSIINTNVKDVRFCKWITLTYAENMQDTKRLYKDFKNFYERFVNRLKSMGIDKPKYINIAEPQGRGAWHCHVLFIWNSEVPYIDNSVVADVWGHGFTVTKKLDNVDNVGAYLTAYLGDMDLQEAVNNNTAEVMRALSGKATIKPLELEGETKYFIKGARLSLYPANFNIYRCSRDIKQPKIETLMFEDAEKKISAGTLTFEKTVQVIDKETNFETIIHKRQYNMVRKSTNPVSK